MGSAFAFFGMGGRGEADGFLRNGGLLRHEGDETVVKIFRGVVTGLFQSLGECGDFDEAGHVAAGANVKDDVRDLQAENLVEIFFQSGALFDGVGSPFVEGNDEVDAFINADALHTKHLANVNDADAATLHVAAIERSGAGDEFAFVEKLDDGEVVGDERVAAFDKGKSAFAFANAAGAAQECADAANIEHGGVLG